MNKMERSPLRDFDPAEVPGDRLDHTSGNTEAGDKPHETSVRRIRGARIVALCTLLLLGGALAIGIWQHYSVHAEVMATAELHQDFVPSVRTAAVRASDATMSVTWPGATEAFEQANIYARASGYISKRTVDIGSRVKARQLLVEIAAPEVEHQIAQAQGTLAQLEAALQQAQANRDLAQVTWDRDGKLVSGGLGHEAARGHRSLDPGGAGCSGFGSRSQRRSAKGATSRVGAAENLSKRGRAI